MRLLYEENIEDIALGAAVLGTGGGGDPYVGKLMAREAIRQYGPVELYSLDELDDDDLIVPSAGMGAPIVHRGKTCPPVHDMIRAFQSPRQVLGSGATRHHEHRSRRTQFHNADLCRSAFAHPHGRL